MFNLAIDSKLRACDFTALKVDDIAMSGRVRSRAIVIQKKTGRPVQFEITEQKGIRLLAGSMRPDFVTAAFSFPAAFVESIRPGVIQRSPQSMRSFASSPVGASAARPA